MENNTAKEHRTVSRVTTILEATSGAADGIRLAGLAHALGAPKSSVHGLVKGLVATGYLSEQEGVYTLGPAIGALLSPIRPTLTVAARRSLEEIERQSHESVMLCSLVGESVVYVDLVESTEMIRYSAPLRRRRPLYPTSAGKCFLAHFPDAKRGAYLAQHVANAGRRAAIEEELHRVRDEGVSYNRGETVPDVFAVATPILVGGRVVACLAVAGPHARMAQKMDQVAEIVRTEGTELARRLS